MNKQQYPIKKKAWTLDHEDINEAWNYDCNFTVYAETKNKAKSKLMKEIKDEEMTLWANDDPVTYINLPIERDEGSDILEFEGAELTLFQINNILDERDRLGKIDKILEDSNVTHVYIYKRNSYYSKNWSGYSSHTFHAGVYEKEEAASHARSCSEISLIPCDISTHNAAISKEIERLKEIQQEEERSLKNFLVDEKGSVAADY